MVRVCRSMRIAVEFTKLWGGKQLNGNRFRPRHYCSCEDYKPQNKRLEGKVAVITGAASGIGAATSRLFVAHGAYVVMADIQDEAGNKLSRELGENTEFCHCDTTQEEDVIATMKKASSSKGCIDVLYCNAGILGAFGPIDQTNMQEFDLTVAVNLRGAVLSMKHATPIMKSARKGSIICTGSVSSVLGGLGPHAYTITKTALVGLVRSTAVELRDYGIRVNMVSPGAVETELFKGAMKTISTPVAKTTRMYSGSHLNDQMIDTLDVAKAALFLASDESRFISGHNLMVDASNSVSRPADKHDWLKVYTPMLREASKRGLS